MKYLLPLLSLLLPLLAFSQNEFYNTGAAVTVQHGALLHVQGSLTNNADMNSDPNHGNVGVITNDGLIE